jgi:PAS domain S-box-containing protein
MEREALLAAASGEPFGLSDAPHDAFRLAIDTVPGLVWSARPDGNVDFLNQRWCDYTGMSLEAARGWGWESAIAPDDLGGLRDYWRGLLQSETPGEVEARLRGADGAYRWFLFRAVPLRDARGVVVRWYGQTTDIDDRKRASALLEAERRLLELVAMGDPLPSLLDALCRATESLEEGALCSVLLVADDGQHLLHVAAPSLSADYVSAVHGAPVATDIGPCGAAVACKQVIVVEDFDHDPRWSADYLAIVRRNGLRAGWSAPILARTGDVLGAFAIYFRRTGTPSPWQSQLIDRFTHVASIAIERSRAQGALQRSEAQLAAAQRLSATGSFTWEPESGAIEWSDEVFRIYGIARGERLDMHAARERVHPDDRAHFDRVASAAVLGGKEFEFGHRLLLPGGEVKHVHVVASPRPADEHGPRRYFGAVRDVTQQQQADEALSRARAELAHVARVTTLGELTASIAHEVNQPLAGIVMNADTSLRLLAERPPDVAQVGEATQRIRRDAQRAADVIVRLRELFRRKASLERQPLDLHDAIRDVLSLSHREFGRHGVELQTMLAPGRAMVLGDRVQLQQVVLNLALNAVEALVDAPTAVREVALGTTCTPDGLVRVTVSDTGPGIAAGDVERVFTAFYTTKRGGMGMGLSIARTIVESHGGRLWAESRDGAGGRFAFQLPALDAPA